MFGVPYKEPPIKADKGLKGGSCNRRACQAPRAFCFNQTMNAYYCRPCAHAINRANPELKLVAIPDNIRELEREALDSETL